MQKDDIRQSRPLRSPRAYGCGLMQKDDIRQCLVMTLPNHLSCGLMQKDDIRQCEFFHSFILKSCGLMQKDDIRQQHSAVCPPRVWISPTNLFLPHAPTVRRGRGRRGIFDRAHPLCYDMSEGVKICFCGRPWARLLRSQWHPLQSCFEEHAR